MQTLKHAKTEDIDIAEEIDHILVPACKPGSYWSYNTMFIDYGKE